MDRNGNRIDAVITWVDGNDPSWLEQKHQYNPKKEVYKAATNNARFRDWDNLQYIFRGIEKHMPWIDMVHFVTWGHLPKWMNTGCDKLHIVKHEHFIPEDFLPTFNTNTIELNFHRIPDLSEQFINFNDDMFVIGPTSAEDFFKHGKPRDCAVLTPFVIIPNGISALEMNNLEVINKYFSRKDIMKNLSKWVNPLYGLKVFRTLIFMQWSSINGIYEPHVPLGFLKSVYEEVWNKEKPLLYETCTHKFRTKADVTDWLIRQWQLMKGEFEPRNINFSKYTCLPQDIETIISILSNPKRCRLICINDSMLVNDFDNLKAKVNQALNDSLPEKSSFEL